MGFSNQTYRLDNNSNAILEYDCRSKVRKAVAMKAYESAVGKIALLYGADMKLYQSVKKVWAEPMTLGEFHKIKDKFEKHSDGPIKGRDDAPGYHVMYGKDTPHEYHSWCPDHIFEAGNILLDDQSSS